MKKLIIIGGGYAGIRAIQKLKGVENLDITLIDIQPYHYLQTEVYSLIATTAWITDVTVDLQSICEFNDNVNFIRSKVTGIDFDENSILCEDTQLFYDYLIIASGSKTNFPKSIGGLKENSIGIKSLDNAFFLKQEFSKQLYALMSRNLSSSDRYFNIVIGGAGLSGVEIAAEMAAKTNRYINANHIDKYKLRIYLISSGESVLKGMNPYLQEKSLERLQKLGVHVLLKTRIDSVDEHVVHLNNGESLDCHYLIFTGGVTTSDFIKKLTGCELSKNGQVVVTDTMQLPAHENTYAIGDVACLKDKEGNPIPSTAHAAEQSAEIATANIKLALEGKVQKKQYVRAEGVLVALGSKNAAVVLFDKYKFSGYLGYLLKHLITWNYKHSLDNNAKAVHKLRV
ncbi:FAD-dependent oxidoreductase [Sulfurimonas sp. SAG-AH-194-C20]|nr:FAD-dependent oxidoreductase [Sulfurimonas sp. SAG-AH-194-C20]MDF1878607.1 FAD-dependent oxidoreductase [Sulfurimonas sp. SAG-AH-194-C20]